VLTYKAAGWKSIPHRTWNEPEGYLTHKADKRRELLIERYGVCHVLSHSWFHITTKGDVNKVRYGDSISRLDKTIGVEY